MNNTEFHFPLLITIILIYYSGLLLGLLAIYVQLFSYVPSEYTLHSYPVLPNYLILFSFHFSVRHSDDVMDNNHIQIRNISELFSHTMITNKTILGNALRVTKIFLLVLIKLLFEYKLPVLMVIVHQNKT